MALLLPPTRPLPSLTLIYFPLLIFVVLLTSIFSRYIRLITLPCLLKEPFVSLTLLYFLNLPFFLLTLLIVFSNVYWLLSSRTNKKTYMANIPNSFHLHGHTKNPSTTRHCCWSSCYCVTDYSWSYYGYLLLLLLLCFLLLLLLLLSILLL